MWRTAGHVTSPGGPELGKTTTTANCTGDRHRPRGREPDRRATTWATSAARRPRTSPPRPATPPGAVSRSIHQPPDRLFIRASGARSWMSFRIEMEPCRGLEARDPEDTTTSEAIESVYRAGPAVCIHMGPRTWARLPVSGGISDIYNDIIRILERLGLGVYPFEISFLCSSFTARWRFSESNGVLTIGTSWTAVDGRFNGREVRDAQFNDAVSRFVVEKQAFVAEWRKLARQLKRDLLSAGYGGRLNDLGYLESLD
jgi:hypothetical protein